MKVYRIYVDLFEDSTAKERNAVFHSVAELVGKTMGDKDKVVYSQGWIEEEEES